MTEQAERTAGHDVPFVVRPRPRQNATDPTVAGGASSSRIAAFAAEPADRSDATLARDHGESLPMPLPGAEPGASSPDWRVFGPLAPFVSRPGVTDVFVNGAGGLWVDDGHGARRDDSWLCDEASLRELAVRLIARGGRHVDEASPCIDVRLQHGIRVHVVLPPISTGGTLISVRVPRAASFDLDGLVSAGMLGVAQRDRLCDAIRRRENLLITGAAGSGKTTLLAALLGEAPATERIVCIEDVAELRPRHPHVISLEARQPNLEGAGGIGLARLVRESLRMRPDRLVVGECRGGEVRELLAALNTGHDGGAGTVHANSLADVPARLEALGALAGLSAEAVARQTVSAFDLVVHLERAGGVRRVAALGGFRLSGSRLAIAAVEDAAGPGSEDAAGLRLGDAPGGVAT